MIHDEGHSVETILEHLPMARTVFRDRRMACAGCTLGAFCTLADAARAYDVPLETLVAEIEAVKTEEVRQENERQ